MAKTSMKIKQQRPAKFSTKMCIRDSIDIIAPSQKTVDALQRLEMAAGVYIDVKMKTK